MRTPVLEWLQAGIQKAHQRDVLKALSARLLSMETSNERRAPRGLSSAQRAGLVDYVEAHLDEPLRLHQLARVVGSSASHLKTLFKRSMGVSVHAYVVQRRVERARRLLREGKLPSAQVALESGFAHQSHMARCIRRLLGVSSEGRCRSWQIDPRPTASVSAWSASARARAT